MSCLHPLEATLYTLDDGKRVVRLGHMLGRLEGRLVGKEITLPCGKCIGCLKDRANDWSVRNYHELFVTGKSSFLTLTYAPEHLPENGSLVKADVQKFMKRLRKRLWKYFRTRVRYFLVGEYGSKGARPHYHVLLFGWDFPDRRFWSVNKYDHFLYVSDFLSKCWKYGWHTIGDVTMESIKYVSKYITKRIYGDESFYGDRIPEFNLSSRNPAIGVEFVKKYADDIYNGDRVVIDASHKYRVPRAYDKWLEKVDKVRYDFVKSCRREKAVDYSLDTLVDKENYAVAIFNVKRQRVYEGDHIWFGPRYTQESVDMLKEYSAWKEERFKNPDVCMWRERYQWRYQN